MLFSYEWLRQLCPVDDDPEKIAAALTSRGLTVDSMSRTGDDHVLDVDIPANRPDCLGHLGLARELSASFGIALRQAAEMSAVEDEAAWCAVSIEAPELCSRYTARLVRDVKIAPSPGWVVRRLEACGLRSINNVVDASNLVLLELGHPIHFFDLDELRGRRGESRPTIVVRRAEDGEVLTTLDGVERRLDRATLVIADAERAVALAGVIGGADTEIGEGTRRVLIEAARFDPASVRATARRLGVQTDASFRFERGVDPETAPTAQDLAVRLLDELAGGKAEPQTVDAYPGRSEPRRLGLRVSEVERLLGYRPDDASVERSLAALGLSPGGVRQGRVEIIVPSWRVDLEREADLVEEVARHLGYDQIPTAPSRLAPGGAGVRSTSPSEHARDVLAHLGFHEAFGYAMIAESADEGCVRPDEPAPLALTNPIAEPMSHLRRSILPGLLRAAELNIRRGNRDVRLFECGRVFLTGKDGPFPEEPTHLALVWSGSPEPRHWSRPPRELDLYDLLGVVDSVLTALHPGLDTPRKPGAREAFHPGLSFTWYDAEDHELAWGGALHPKLQESIDAPIFMAEIDVDAVERMPRERQLHRRVPRVPAVTRDLAVVMTGEKSYADVVQALRQVASPAPAEFDALDRYEGPPLEHGEASLTLRVTLRPSDRTLTDPETEDYRRQLVERLDATPGVRMRG